MQPVLPKAEQAHIPKMARVRSLLLWWTIVQHGQVINTTYAAFLTLHNLSPHDCLLSAHIRAERQGAISVGLDLEYEDGVHERWTWDEETERMKNFIAFLERHEQPPS